MQLQFAPSCIMYMPWCTFKLLYLGVTLLWKLLWSLDKKRELFSNPNHVSNRYNNMQLTWD